MLDMHEACRKKPLSQGPGKVVPFEVTAPAMSATSSGASPYVRDYAADPHLFPYNSQASKQHGSRKRILNAALLCCIDQYLLTLCDLEETYFPVSELHWRHDNAVSAIMKRNLSEKFYIRFLQFAWGSDLASQFLLQ